MFANLTGLLPLLSVASVLIVSANTIGYFSHIGLHFLGLMDFTNFVYPLGLAFTGLIAVLQLLTLAYRLAPAWRGVAEFNLSNMQLYGGLYLIGGLAILYYLPLHNSFYQILAFLAHVTAASVVYGIIAFVKFHQNRGKIDDSMTVFFIVSILGVCYFAGIAEADYQAFRSPTFYRIIDKHGFDTVFRIVRASSSGLLVSSTDRRIIFVPKEEIRQVESEKPIGLNLSDW
jgi:hypothetical protein